MQRSSRISKYLVVFTLGVGSAGCLGTIEFDAREPKRPPTAKSNVRIYLVECSEPAPDLSDCTFKGTSVRWKVLGSFRTTPKAAGKWARYRSEVWELAASKGCPGVAIRRDPPVYAGGKAIGAFCVDITATTASTPVGSDPSVAVVPSPQSSASSFVAVDPPGIAVSASASAIASPTAPSEEEHTVTTVANGVVYFDLGVRNGLHVGSRVDVLGDDGTIRATVQTDLCGEIVCRAQLSPTLVFVVKRGMRVRAVAKP